jgi:hypothetical protein
VRLIAALAVEVAQRLAEGKRSAAGAASYLDPIAESDGCAKSDRARRPHGLDWNRPGRTPGGLTPHLGPGRLRLSHEPSMRRFEGAGPILEAELV